MTTPRLRVDDPGRPGGRVRVAVLDDGSVTIRSGETDGGAVLTFTQEEWRAFVAGVKNSEFDLAALG